MDIGEDLSRLVDEIKRDIEMKREIGGTSSPLVFILSLLAVIVSVSGVIVFTIIVDGVIRQMVMQW